jgi:hypothetical protein
MRKQSNKADFILFFISSHHLHVLRLDAYVVRMAFDFIPVPDFYQIFIGGDVIALGSTLLPFILTGQYFDFSVDGELKMLHCFAFTPFPFPGAGMGLSASPPPMTTPDRLFHRSAFSLIF